MIIKQRIVTGLFLLPLLILFIGYAGPWFFAGLVGVVSLLALDEFYGMSLSAGRVLERRLAGVSGALLVPLLCWQPSSLQPALTVLVFGLALLFLFRFGDIATVVPHLAMVTFGLLYVPLLLGHLALLRFLPQGRLWVFLVLVIVMVGDSAAYFVGSAWGRRRLYPAISPKKSIEGALGGLAGSLLGALLFKVCFFPALKYHDAALLGLGLGCFSQLGDLFESMLKRGFGVKDSGTLIPGHGGILDRLDSLLFAFPLAYYYALWAFAG